MTITEYLNQSHTKETTQSYERAINHFLTHSKHKENSTYADVINYLTEHHFNSTRILAGIKRYFDYLIETNQRADHPCKTLAIKRSTRYVQFQELFTPDELELLLKRPSRYQNLKDRNQAILSLLIYQGLTSANISNLRLSDIDIDEGTVYIKATKTTNRRTLELKPKQVILLYRYINESRPKLMKNTTKQLFIGKNGTPFSVETLNRMLRPLQSLYLYKNLNATAIRKSVICNWLNEEKIALEDVQLLSGQKWMSSTEKYLKPNAEKKRGLINEFFPL